MALFTQTILLRSALPPNALLDRIRGLAAGKLSMPTRSRWFAPVRWSLRELPDAIRLMPLFPPSYLTQQPSLIGRIEPEGSGSVVSGRIQPCGLTVGVMAFLVFMSVAMSAAGVMQQFSRHEPGKAAEMALFGIGFAAVAAAAVGLSVWFAAASIRQLLETAASGDPPGNGAIQPAGAIVPEMRERSMSGSFVLRSAAAIDVLIALFLITTSVVSSRVGRPVTLLIAAILVIGAGFLSVIANRLSGGVNDVSSRMTR